MSERLGWLLLMHQLPPQPDYFRVKVWRRLRAIGAVSVKNSVYALPDTPDAREDFEWLVREITDGGGEAVLCEARFIAGLTDANLQRLLRHRPSRGTTAARPTTAPARTRQRPRGAVWVTRRGIHVDRIASAWLIWRFVDTAARFRFVDADAYHRGRRELRFDMFDAEYTHVGPKCTFEVLLDSFGLRSDGALTAIGEIVHDIDLKENAFARGETSDVRRALEQVYAEHGSDEARLEHGGVLFESLYAMFSTATG